MEIIYETELIRIYNHLFDDMNMGAGVTANGRSPEQQKQTNYVRFSPQANYDE
jgi:hypothetical protein